jgi:PII-like signaling protein
VSELAKLTVYLGERTRTHDGLASDELAALYERHVLQTSVLLRGMAGFGAKHHLHTDRQLTLSEDLPLVSVAVDTREQIELVAAEVRSLGVDGRVTIESARSSPIDAETKLTLYLRRGDNFKAVVQELHDCGVGGATVLLGVDGTYAGARRRARFFGANGDVPLMVISVGAADRIAAALNRIPSDAVITHERIRICKRDGERLAQPEQRGEWQKLMVYVGEQAHHDGHPLHSELLLRLQRAGAAGVTSLRGIWGYHGDHAPHGDTFWQLRRRVPIVTVVVDRAERIQDWFAIVDELTSATGLVTSEVVPVA